MLDRQHNDPFQKASVHLGYPGESMHLLLKVANNENYDFYSVALKTSGYSHPNSQETDNIFHGYNYTNVLDALKKWSADQGNFTGELVDYLNQKLAQYEYLTVTVSSATKITQSERGSKVNCFREASTGLDTSIGAVLLERSFSQPIHVKVYGFENNQTVNGIIKELIDYGINGSSQIAFYSAEFDEYPFVDETSLKENPRGIGQVSIQTLERMLGILHEVLSEGKIPKSADHLLDPARRVRLQKLLDTYSPEEFNQQTPEIEILKSPQYPGMDSDTMFVFMQRKYY